MPNAEAVHWLEVIDLHLSLYKKPFTAEVQQKNKNTKLSLLKNAIMGYITTNSKLSFTLEELMANVQKPKSLKPNQTVQQAFEETLRRLWNEGVIITTQHGGSRTDWFGEDGSGHDLVYHIVGHHNLTQLISTVICDSKGGQGGPQEFRLNRILYHVRSNRMYKCIKSAQVLTSLRFLESEGRICKLNQYMWCPA